MKCAWESLLAVIPPKIRRELSPAEGLRELRLRVGQVPELNMGNRQRYLSEAVKREDLLYVINAASRYSPWAAKTMGKGYLTIPGGHRIGLTGQAVSAGAVLRTVDSLCVRIAQDIDGIGKAYGRLNGSSLIIGAPGWGKTTFLRDIARTLAETKITVVVDERGELFPEGFRRGKRMDVMQYCPKAKAIPMALRTMGPEWIAVDEITEPEDCKALISAANCGVKLLATAHAVSTKDLYSREVYIPLMERRLFQNIIVLRQDQSCVLERMGA